MGPWAWGQPRNRRNAAPLEGIPKLLSHALVAVSLVWLLVLTVLMLALIRHVAALQAVGGNTQAPAGGWLFETDGPFIPSPLPGIAADVLRRRDVATDDVTITFFSSMCGSCVERATEIVQTRVVPAQNLFLVTGDHPGALEDMRRILEPTGALVLSDPDAHDIIKSVDIRSTPFVFRIVRDRVVAKGYLKNADVYHNIVGMTADEAVAKAAGYPSEATRPVELVTAEVRDGVHQ